MEEILIIGKRKVYYAAYQESLRNAEAWLADANALYERGSRGHARALFLFAGEEVGKSHFCWLAVKGVIPFNHPLVDYRKRTSVFGSHALKSESSVLLVKYLSEREAKQRGEDVKLVHVIEEESPVKYIVGKKLTEDRSYWMYVDIIETEEGPRVTSPLTSDKPIDMDMMSRSIQRSIDYLKATDNDDHVEYLKQHRHLDPDFPENPEWE